MTADRTVDAGAGPTRVDEDAFWRFLSDLSLDTIGEARAVTVGSLVLDHFTCAVLGMNLPWTRIVRESFEPLSAEPGHRDSSPYLWSASRYGSSEPLSTLTAAVVNGTATHGLDFDDLYLSAMTHPAAVVIPAAFAVGSALGRRGHSFLAAVAAGYECMGRVGDSVGVRNVDHGFHGTGQQGPLGSATAVGRLLAFDGAGLANACGLAASFGGGIKAFTAGPGMVKRLHAGRAAEAGILAAHLSVHGFRGPVDPLTSKFGFVRVFALDAQARPERLTDDLGDRFVVDDIYLKPYAACGALHGAIAAAEQLGPLDPEDVESVVVGSSVRAVDQNSDPNPADVMAAQYSMEYSVALALLGTVRDATRFLAVESGDDAVVRGLASKVRVEVDRRAEKAYPVRNEGRVDVVSRRGGTRSAYGISDPQASRGWEVAEAKWHAATQALLAPEVREAVVRGVRGLVDDGPLDACVEPLSGTV